MITAIAWLISIRHRHPPSASAIGIRHRIPPSASRHPRSLPLIVGRPERCRGNEEHRMESVVPFASEPGFWTGHWRNVGLQIWGGEVTVPRIDRCGECNLMVLQTHPQRLVTVAIILSTAKPRVGSAERKRVASLADEQRGTTLAAVQIVDGNGFWAAAVRAVLTGLNFVGKTQHHVFDADAPAAHWLVGAKVVDAAAAEVHAAMAQARRMYVGP
jgi:hypothetical protein